MTQDELKALVGQAALEHVVPGAVIGVGTGSTVNCFIDALATHEGPHRRRGLQQRSEHACACEPMASSCSTATGSSRSPVYVDGADEIDHQGCMIKGGGGALTREKIVADLAERFVCIADESKLVRTLGRFALPVEVIPMAAAQVARRLRRLGGEPVLRAGVVTDNGCHLIDVKGLAIFEPAALESEINQWPGVVCVGIFARHRASVCLLGTADGVRTLTF